MDEPERLELLEQRVSALESALTENAAQKIEDAAAAGDTFWALNGLRARVGDPGAVMMVGSVQTPGGQEARWQMATSTEDLFGSDFAERAESLSALAHPVRMRILQKLMTDAETVHDLAATGDFGTSGQIYHHLRQLTSHGWLRSVGGGKYAVPEARMVPLLTILLGVDR